MSCAPTKNGHAIPNGSASDGRDANGRFAPGNTLGHGNPFARQAAALRRRIVAAVKPEDLDEVIHGLVESAKARDIQATKLLLAYLVGKPGPVADPDALDRDEWRLRASAPPAGAAYEVINNHLPLDLLNVYARGMDLAHWQTAEDSLKDPPAAKPKPGGITPRSLDKQRLTAALGVPRKKKERGKRESIFQRLRRNGEGKPGGK